MTAKLRVFYGCMFANKTSLILQEANHLKVCEQKYIIVKPKIDTRYSSNRIVSHNSYHEECYNVENLFDIVDIITRETINTIFIDEAQFFKNLVKPVLHFVEDLNVNVVVTGLDGDSERNKFGEILDLIPYSDEARKLTALCAICKDGTPGLFSFRKVNNNNQVCLGGANEFMPLCRKHFIEYKN